MAIEGEDLELDELHNSASSSQKQQHKQLQQGAPGEAPATSHQLLMPAKSNASPSSAPPTPPEDGLKPLKNGDTAKVALVDPAPLVAKAFQTQAMPNGKTQTSVKTMSKRKISQQKEKKATQMLAIVLGQWIYTYIYIYYPFCCPLLHVHSLLIRKQSKLMTYLPSNHIANV